MINYRIQEAHDDSKSKTEKQLFALNNTLKNMIRANRIATLSVQMNLDGFYKEISKSIKWK